MLPNTGSLREDTPGPFSIAYGDVSSFRLYGEALADAPAVLELYGQQGAVVGAAYDSRFTLTNPFNRSREGLALLESTLIITRFTLSYTDSAGFRARVVADDGVEESVTLARRVGSPSNIIGEVVLDTDQGSVPVGREVKEVAVTISALDWLPLTISNIGWTGQLFQRARSM